MRIGFIHPSSPLSEGTGATHSATQIVTGLAQAGHDVDVYCATEPEPDTSLPDITLHYLDGNSNHPHTSTKLNREVRARSDDFRDYDILHSYLTPLIPSVADLGKELDVGTVVTLNAYGGVCAKNDLLYLNEGQCKEKSTTKCLNCITRTGFSNNEHGYLYQTVSQLFSLRSINVGERRLKHIDAFRAPSGHVRDNYAKFGFPAERIHVIPHPLDDKFLVEHTSDFSEPIKLLYVGYLEKQKGVDKLVPVLDGLQKREFDVQLTIAGTGGLRSGMEKQARESGIEQDVDFLGFVSNDELPSLYAGHDVFIHPGIWEEPLARVYIEALATGTPIVTRQYGSIDSIIGDGGVTTDGSIEDFIQTIQIMVNENQLVKYSAAAKEKIEEYRAGRIVPRIEQAYTMIK